MRTAAILALLCVCGALSACESTQQKSKRIGEQQGTLEQEQGLVVGSQNRDVEIVSTETLQDQNGAAAIVTVRNRSKRSQAALPIAINVTGKGGKSVFRNNAPGLEPSLVRVSVLSPGQSFTWVNDQVTPVDKPRDVKARVGNGKQVKAIAPKVSLSAVKLEQDPVSGVAAVGVAINRSKVEQRKLVVYAVARKRGKVVAAGRGQIKRLKPGKRGRFTVFFIGNPKGAKLSVTAPPTVLG